MSSDDTRRERYAAAIHRVDRVPGPGYPGWEVILEHFPDDAAAYREMADAVMAMADEELAGMRTERDNATVQLNCVTAENSRLREELAAVRLREEASMMQFPRPRN